MTDEVKTVAGWSRKNEVKIGPFVFDGSKKSWIIWGHVDGNTAWLEHCDTLAECRMWLIARDLIGDVTISLNGNQMPLHDDADWAMARLTYE